MKGMELSRLYYEKVCKPVIEKEAGELTERTAVGLVGEGSECYGYDDEISRDHDFGPSCCFWLTKEDYRIYGGKLREILDSLPKSFMSFPALKMSEWGGGRRGVLNTESFYRKFTGKENGPETLDEWRMIPETNLSIVTNGSVFSDPLGEFTKIRNRLLEYYPEDIRLDKIASRCMKIAQSGQYNLGRCLKRGEFVAARIAEAEFINESIYMIYLLNKKYMPFYKWMHKDMQFLPILGKEVHNLLNNLISIQNSEKPETAEKICGLIINELKIQGISENKSDFLLDHGPDIQRKISDESLRNSNPWID
ncbi:Uncharacterised protein [Sebaldella termitidis]|uniref:DUF4037 domain-containing protein n=1 Tax=Sebaldella termitidis (strain ATCC 33386 / NCTC 11300) TaxID=526218 RepID=D1AQ92_SEBTE|nr:DUF4037 domain-containing protein [Sebaldella termitidis]ACZ10152.1 conserved hypothetical protein [Sebaldella termitidis ATCC 33386]SUI25490.1 Uncharacterised protein [Sebaldella termitidis]